MTRLVLTLLFLCGNPLWAKEYPNIILIVADDLGRNDLGCYGSKFHRTPNLDQFAAKACKFENAYAACPVCSPTRAALMTGKFPARLHITDWLPGRPVMPDQAKLKPKIRQELPLDEITIAEILKCEGYKTGHIGKWHLGGKGFGPKEQGFDVNIAGDHTGTPLSYFAPFQGKKVGFMPGLEEAKDGEYLTDRLTTEAEKFIEANKSGPFFLYLPHYAVHTPMRAKEELIKHFPNQPQFGKQSNAIYAAMLESLDESVGRVFKKLDDLKLTQQTIVIFTSDNGGLATLEGMPNPPTYNGPHREGKGFLYEGGIRVPMIVHAPGTIKPGTVCKTMTSSYDVLPTILDLVGIKLEKPVDGVSILPAWKGDTQNRPALYWHYPHYSNQTSKPAGAIRDGDYKLIEFYEDGRQELFNVAKDISESQNLIATEPKIAQKLAKALNDWRVDIGAQMMTDNPSFVPNLQAKSGTILLPAKFAKVHGIQLRFEPLPHKNTLGFWTKVEDWAEWDFTVQDAGKFKVEILQGCGNGSGGSEVEVIVGKETLNFTVKETGGFQKFEPREIGEVTINTTGRHQLQIKPKKKPGVAVMDVREVRLKPIQ
jgi:arylsulfatase A